MAKYNIHAGHNPDGKIACGAVGIIKESTQARKVKEYLINYLRGEGHSAYDCTCDNGKSQSDVLVKIVNKCNEHDVDLDVSIHFNSGAGDQKGNGKTTGTEVLIYSDKSKAKPYAERIVKKIAALGFKNRGVKFRNDLYVLKRTNSPSLLVECCFVDDKDDCNLYDAKKMAKAIAEGILNKSLGTSTTNTSDKNTSIKAVKKLSLKDCPVYSSSTSKDVYKKKTGTYYVWSKEIVNGRVRITNTKDNVGKSGQVTGWINKKQAE